MDPSDLRRFRKFETYERNANGNRMFSFIRAFIYNFEQSSRKCKTDGRSLSFFVVQRFCCEFTNFPYLRHSNSKYLNFENLTDQQQNLGYMCERYQKLLAESFACQASAICKHHRSYSRIKCLLSPFVFRLSVHLYKINFWPTSNENKIKRIFRSFQKMKTEDKSGLPKVRLAVIGTSNVGKSGKLLLTFIATSIYFCASRLVQRFNICFRNARTEVWLVQRSPK